MSHVRFADRSAALALLERPRPQGGLGGGVLILPPPKRVWAQLAPAQGRRARPPAHARSPHQFNRSSAPFGSFLPVGRPLHAWTGWPRRRAARPELNACMRWLHSEEKISYPRVAALFTL